MNIHKMDKKTTAAILALAIILDDKRRRNRSIWVKNWVARRHQKGAYQNLLQELRFEDPDSYRRYLRMDEDTFTTLLKLVTPRIIKMDTHYRKAITPAEKLAITLRFLATGESQWSLSTQFRVAQGTISLFIQEVCASIYDGLKQQYFQLPSSKSEWRKIASGFESVWNFPHCVGAIDGKHIAIKCPPGSGSKFFNYKKFYSIVLMAVVDYDLNFLYVDVGSPRRNCDGGIWSKCSLNVDLLENSVLLPEPEAVFGFRSPLPFVFVADEAFPLRSDILRPYSSNGLTNPRRIYNYRLSRARRIVENAFGVLASTWAILQKPIPATPEKVENMILCICTLQNYLRSKTSTRALITPPGTIDIEDLPSTEVIPGSWRKNLQNTLTSLEPLPGKRYGDDLINMRDQFCEYFNTSGSVPWQKNVLKI